MSQQAGFQRVLDWLPGLRLLLNYDRTTLAPDLTAGVVVTLVLIPSAIAYADLAKCPPIEGHAPLQCPAVAGHLSRGDCPGRPAGHPAGRVSFAASRANPDYSRQ